MKLEAQRPAGGRFPRLSAFVRKTRRPLFFALLLGGMAWGGYAAWTYVRPSVALDDDFRFDPKQIEINPPPEWIHSDIKAQVIHDAGWDTDLSLLDEQLTVHVAQAFSLHPWVAKVHRVSKARPSGIRVALEYRKPVAMVEVSGGLLAVDIEGVVLPSEDFNEVNVRQYMSLTGIQSGPRGPVGTRWGDNGVAGGAQLAAFLQNSWRELKIKKIVPHISASNDSPENLIYSLVTTSGRILNWGHLPGKEGGGELPAAEKLVRLQRHMIDNGSLDQGDPLPNGLFPQPRSAAVPKEPVELEAETRVE